MIEYLESLKESLLEMGKKYHVNPFLFSGIYLTSKLFVFSFLGWTLKNLREKKPVLIPLVCASVSFSIPYLYLIIAGRNIPVWVYVIIGMIFSYGAFSIWNRLRKVA